MFFLGYVYWLFCVRAYVVKPVWLGVPTALIAVLYLLPYIREVRVGQAAVALHDRFPAEDWERSADTVTARILTIPPR